MVDPKALKKKLAALQDEHRDLDNEIKRLDESPSYDRLKTQRLKKRKLALKDQITQIENKILPDIIA